MDQFDERLVPGAITREMRRISREAGRQRVFPTTLHLGHPDGERLGFELQPWQDRGARVDLVIRALESLPFEEPLVWLRRTGNLEPEGVDWRCLAAARTAYAIKGLHLRVFHVVTRHGWWEVLSDRRVDWRRPQPQPQ